MADVHCGNRQDAMRAATSSKAFQHMLSSARVISHRVGSRSEAFCHQRYWHQPYGIGQTHSRPVQTANQRTIHTVNLATMHDITYLNQEQAQAIDAELMGELGFSVDQLMELAGLSVACAVHSEYPKETHPRVLVFVGPGNNGGDGLVAARHLHHFGHQVRLCYPKRTDKPLFTGLVKQCESLNLPFIEPIELHTSELSEQADVIIDALFGFSFKGPPRPPLDRLLEVMHPKRNPPHIVSVDIPSGWDVEKGDVEGDGIRPEMLMSLTAPKLGAKDFRGIHYLGGRFVPPVIKEKYHLNLPDYPNMAQCVRID